MANKDHIEELSKGPRAWNIWRVAHPTITPDFESAQFTLWQRQLGPSHGEPVNLQHADLRSAFLYFSFLTEADLSFADLSGANLAFARLEKVNFKASDLTGAIFDEANFQDADLTDARIGYTDLSKAKHLTQEQIDSAWGNDQTQLPDGLTPPEKWFRPPEDPNRPQDFDSDETAFSSTDDPQAGEEPSKSSAQHQTESGPSSRTKKFVHGDTLNFYALMNVSPLATTSEIRSAYRKLAKDFHPDLNPDDPQAEEDFKLLSAVFKVLSDPEKRRHYDDMLGFSRENPNRQSELFR